MHNTPLSTRQRLVRLALVGLIPLLITVFFLWAGGWLTPQRLSADKLVDVLQQSGGKYAAVSLCIGVGQGLTVILERV